MTTSKVQNEELARWIWTMIIVGFFSIQAIIWFVAITLTWRDPSFAVAAQYERDAERWDEILAQRRVSEQLGWAVDFSTTPVAAGEKSQLQIRVADRNGAAVNDAQVELVLFHCARAAESQSPRVIPYGNGVYLAEASIHRNGQWKLTGSVRRGDEVYYFDRKQRLERSGGNP